MTRRYASEILPIIGPERDIPAPDVGTDEQTMAWFMDTVSVQTGYTVTGAVTGKPISLGGSQGRTGATSRGVEFITLDALRTAGKRPEERDRRRAGLRQGRRPRRTFLHEAGCRVVAVSDVGGGIYDATGLDVPALMQRARPTAPHRSTTAGVGRRHDNEELLRLDVDVLIPPRSTASSPTRTPTAYAPSIIVEGANGPTTPAADAILADRGITVVPGHPGQRGRRRRLLLRVGPGPAGVLLGRARGQREAREGHAPHVRGGARWLPRSTRSACAAPRRSSPWAGWPKPTGPRALPLTPRRVSAERSYPW